MTGLSRPEMNVAAVCNAAADLLERDGWCQGRLMDDKGRRCVVEALLEVTPHAHPPVVRRIEEHLGMPWMHIVGWNNDPSRTAEEVIAALRGTAREHACPQ